MVPFNLEVLAKFGPCSNCSQKLDECSLARARKIFAIACMLGFWLKFSACSGSIICILKQKLTLETMFPVWQTGKHWGNMHALDILLKLSDQSSVPGSRVTLPETFCL